MSDAEYHDLAFNDGEHDAVVANTVLSQPGEFAF
jgi:hypothetical protein